MIYIFISFTISSELYPSIIYYLYKMSDVIDLTNDDDVRQGTRVRKLPNCGYCGTVGHTIRSCNDPSSMNSVRQLRQMINRFPPFQTIIDWLNTHAVLTLQFILAKYTCSAYKKYSKEMCIDILTIVIQEKYREEEQRNLATTEESLRRGNILIWASSGDALSSANNENIPQSYRQYCAQIIEDMDEPIPDAECDLLCNIIHTRTIPRSTPYHTVKRFYAFVLYRHAQYETDQATRLVVSDDDGTPIKYIIWRKKVSERTQIECPICMENKETPDVAYTICHHQFCWDCIYSTITSKNTERSGCPLCRKPIYKIIRETY